MFSTYYYLVIHTNTYMHVITTNEKRGPEFKGEWGEACGKMVGGRKQKGEML